MEIKKLLSRVKDLKSLLAEEPRASSHEVSIIFLQYKTFQTDKPANNTKL